MKRPAQQKAGNRTGSAKGKPAPAGMDFAALVSAIGEVHNQCAAQVCRTVNVALTLRNWVIWATTREYEQNGAGRAANSASLLATLAQELSDGLDRCYTGRYITNGRYRSDIEMCRPMAGAIVHIPARDYSWS